MKYVASFVAVVAAFTLGGHEAHAGQRISIRVSPAVALAPAFLRVQVTVEPNDDNRLLDIEIDSPAYSRTSEITLDGKNAQRVNLLEVKGVPSGLYEVRATLTGPSGPIAKSMQIVKVEPAAGAR
jgi:hypothetical protein